MMHELGLSLLSNFIGAAKCEDVPVSFFLGRERYGRTRGKKILSLVVHKSLFTRSLTAESSLGRSHNT